MSKGLFFTSTSLNSRTGINNGSILCHLKIFETLVSDIDCLSMYKQSNSSKVKEFVYELSGISISNCITDFSEVLEYYQNEYRKKNRLRLLEKYKRVFACATEFLVHETKEK